jgi:phenylalanyl-tRNA synthetase beta chain
MRTFRPTTVREDSFIDVSGRLRELMGGMGFLEAKTSPFAPTDEGDVRLLNPLSEREDHLRRDLLTGLVHRAEYNFARGQRDVRLYEIGTAFASSDAELPDEEIRIAAIWTGGRTPLHWSGGADDWDVWDLKSIFEDVAAVAWPDAEIRPADARDEVDLEEPLALVLTEGRTIARAGRVPADKVEAPRWAADVWGLEVAIQPGRPEPTHYQPLPVYPLVERDLALIVPAGTLASEVGVVIRDSSPPFLESLSVFDVYEGENIPEGTRSIAWRLRFRSPDRTLTDEEVDAAIRRITSALEEKLDVGIRGA